MGGEREQSGEEAATPPASILFPGLDGKASPTRDLPAPTAPCGRKPRAGCRMPSRVALKGRCLLLPTPEGPEGAGEALHTVTGLQIAVALPVELVRHLPPGQETPPSSAGGRQSPSSKL